MHDVARLFAVCVVLALSNLSVVTKSPFVPINSLSTDLTGHTLLTSVLRNSSSFKLSVNLFLLVAI